MGLDLTELKLKVRQFIEHSPANSLLDAVSKKTSIDKEILFVSIVSGVGLILLLVCGVNLLVDIAGFVYPLYASVKAIESADTADDKQWLTYWIIFTQFKIIESVADFLISFIPLYFLIKIAFLVWCYHPSFNGATVLYDIIIKEHVLPVLGISATPFTYATAAAKTAPPPSKLEVTVEKVSIETEEEKVPVYVELCAHPKDGRQPSGVEGTFFKTDTVEGINIAFQKKIILSPLPDSDGFLCIRVMEKNTFGDDKVLGERKDLQISTFKSSLGERMVFTIGSAEVTFTAIYTA
mmetsp:Transcript_11776/g.17834  ORF Transcript_11776/g.17834 Transcript_11776/m.17834 type:complete len:294 (+) Transcript_11776:55-936(+)